MLHNVAARTRVAVIFVAFFASTPTVLLAQDDNAQPSAPASAEPVAGESTELGGDAAPGAQNFFASFFSNPINLILLSAILFMFIVVRPQQRQYKELQKALAEVKKNTRIVTSGGIHGTVVQTNDNETVVIRIDEASGAKLTINRDAIAKVVVPEDNKNKKA